VKRNHAAVEKKKLEEIEQKYFVWRSSGKAGSAGGSHSSSLVSEIAAARKHIGDVLKEGKSTPAAHSDAHTGSSKDGDRISKLEKDNSSMRQELSELRKLVEALRLKIDESSPGKTGGQAAKPAAAPPATKPKPKAESDDDVDLFGSDEEEDEEKKPYSR